VPGKQRKSTDEFAENDARLPAGVAAPDDSSEPQQPADENENWRSDGQDSAEFPISEGFDTAANEAAHPDNGGFQEILKQSTVEGKQRLSAAMDSGYVAGRKVSKEYEDEMLTRRWSTFLVGAFVGGIAGYLIASRHPHDR
jgi:hypothetical protein